MKKVLMKKTTPISPGPTGVLRLRKRREDVGKECAADHHEHDVGGDQCE
jgi:hypothetical protein